MCVIPSGATGYMPDPRFEKEKREEAFDCEITETLNRRVTIRTTDYAEEDEPDYYETIINTDDTDWKEAFAQDGHYTIGELLHVLREYVAEEQKNVAPYSGRGKELKRLLKEIDGWETIETDIGLYNNVR